MKIRDITRTNTPPMLANVLLYVSSAMETLKDPIPNTANIVTFIMSLIIF